jgi:hypothetical protein
MEELLSSTFHNHTHSLCTKKLRQQEHKLEEQPGIWGVEDNGNETNLRQQEHTLEEQQGSWGVEGNGNETTEIGESKEK